MTITIAPGVANRLKRTKDAMVLQVQGANDMGAALAGLDMAPDALAMFGDDIRFVSPALPAADGPWILIDATDAPAWKLEGIPDVLADCLVEAGVAEATIVALSATDNGPLSRALRKPVSGVLLRLYPPPPPPDHRSRAELPSSWLKEAWEWVRADMDDGASVRALVDGVEFDLAVADVAAFWESCRHAPTVTAAVVAGDTKLSIRGANPSFCAFTHNLALGGGGPRATDDELVATAERFAALARRLAPELALAYVSVDAHHGFHGAGQWLWEGPQGPTLESLCDELVFDAFAWQVLGPGHVARLGGPPQGARPLQGDRVELAVGEWQDWFPEDAERRSRVQDEGRRILDRCLITPDEGDELFVARKKQFEESAPPAKR